MALPPSGTAFDFAFGPTELEMVTRCARSLVRSDASSGPPLLQRWIPSIAGYLGVGEPPRRQIRAHLASEKMRMHVNSRTPAVFLNDLLYAARHEWSKAAGFEKVVILRVGAQVALEDKAEAAEKLNAAIIAPLTLLDEDFARVQIDIVDLAHADGRVDV